VASGARAAHGSSAAAMCVASAPGLADVRSPAASDRRSRPCNRWRNRLNLSTVEMKAFVPAIDFERSKAFYRALGFEIPWSSDDLAYVRFGDTSFLLRAVDDAGFAGEMQMHLLVEDVNDWHAHVITSGVAQDFGVDVGPLVDQPWAMRDFALFDPAGVFWRIAQNLPVATPA
jgi:catechol 2,3-dioxygenase-like lactoylglutathione lyase family enzyme